MALVSHCLKHSLVSMTTILSGILHLPCGFPLCLLGWFLFLCLIPGHHCSPLSRSWLLLVLSLRLMTLHTCVPRGFCIFLSSPWSSRLTYSIVLKKKTHTYSFFLILSSPRYTLLLLGEDSIQARKQDFTRYRILSLRSPIILRNICWLFKSGPYKCFHWRNSYLIDPRYIWVYKLEV